MVRRVLLTFEPQIIFWGSGGCLTGRSVGTGGTACVKCLPWRVGFPDLLRLLRPHLSAHHCTMFHWFCNGYILLQHMIDAADLLRLSPAVSGWVFSGYETHVRVTVAAQFSSAAVCVFRRNRLAVPSGGGSLLQPTANVGRCRHPRSFTNLSVRWRRDHGRRLGNRMLSWTSRSRMLF